MNHYEFKFKVSMLLQDNDSDNDNDSENDTKTINNTKYFDIDDTIEWYNIRCEEYASITDEISNPVVTYLSNEYCYKVEFDMEGIYEDAKFQAEMLVDPDDDGNYPIVSNGETFLIMGELIDDKK